MGVENYECGNCGKPAKVWWHTGLPLCDDCNNFWLKEDFDRRHEIDSAVKDWL